MIYLDNAATTPVYSEVVAAMMPYFINQYGNPSAIYDYGRTVKRDIEKAREIIADSINAEPEEIFFTSGATESNNWVIRNEIEAYETPRIITTNIEHSSVLQPIIQLKSVHPYVDVTTLRVDKNGLINVQDLTESYDTLVSVMYANNEIGTIQPIKEIGDYCYEHSLRFHTDATQAYCHIPIDVKAMHIDYLSASGHKINAPKGIGFLYVNKELQYSFYPFIYGGHQQDGLRAGTENVPYIIGLAKAVEMHQQYLGTEETEMLMLRTRLWNALMQRIDGISLNGSEHYRLYGNINMRVEGVKAEDLIAVLNDKEIYISAGSACNSGSPKPSHVLTAIGLSPFEAEECVRITLGKDTTVNMIDVFIKEFCMAVEMLRGGKKSY